MIYSNKMILGIFSLAGMVAGFAIGYLLLDSVVSGVILGAGLGLAFAASAKVARGKKNNL